MSLFSVIVGHLQGVHSHDIFMRGYQSIAA
jgi:hypothetical protein